MSTHENANNVSVCFRPLPHICYTPNLNKGSTSNEDIIEKVFLDQQNTPDSDEAPLSPRNKVETCEPPNETERIKVRNRVLANRRSARESYLRRKKAVSNLEKVITSLRKDNTFLLSDNKRLQIEVLNFQRQLGYSLTEKDELRNSSGINGKVGMTNTLLQQLAVEQQRQQQQQQQLLHSYRKSTPNCEHRQLQSSKEQSRLSQSEPEHDEQSLREQGDADQLLLEFMLKEKIPP